MKPPAERIPIIDDPDWLRAYGAGAAYVNACSTDPWPEDFDAQCEQAVAECTREAERRAALSDDARWAEDFQRKHSEPWSEAWADRHDAEIEREAARLDAAERALSPAMRTAKERRAKDKSARLRALIFNETPAPPAASQFYRGAHDPYGGRKWLVYQTLPERGAALMAGISRAGKTFAAIDLAVSVTAGLPFAGRAADRTGGVLYLAAEGSAEIPVRWKAATELRGCANDDLPFLWTDTLPCRLLDKGAVERFTALAADAALDLGDTPLALIVIDTMAVAAGFENENDNAQASRAMDVLQCLSRATGALVLAVDHHGKNAEAGTRGASAKTANADAVLALLAEADGGGVLRNRRLLISKNKGGPEGELLPFDLKPIVVGTDKQGRQITKCTVDWTARAPTRPQERMPRDATAALQVLRGMGGKAKEDVWREQCDEGRQVSAAPERASRLKAIKRAQMKLLDAGQVRCGDGEIWINPAPEFTP